MEAPLYRVQALYARSLRNGTRDFSRGACSRYSRFIGALDHGQSSAIAHNPLATGIFFMWRTIRCSLAQNGDPACPEQAISLTSAGASPRLKSRVPLPRADEMYTTPCPGVVRLEAWDDTYTDAPGPESKRDMAMRRLGGHRDAA